MNTPSPSSRVRIYDATHAKVTETLRRTLAPTAEERAAEVTETAAVLAAAEAAGLAAVAGTGRHLRVVSGGAE